jgi:hypothetical protein
MNIWDIEKNTRCFRFNSTESKKHKISVITLILTGLSLYRLKISGFVLTLNLDGDIMTYDIELGIKPDFGGIRVFGDPIATVIHSILFPRMTPSIAIIIHLKHIQVKTTVYICM